MTTSGSWNFSMTAANIIQAAYEDLGILAPGVSPSSAQSTRALSRLNMLVKQWQSNTDMAPGLKVWTRQRVTLFLAVGQQSYLVGPASTDARASTQVGRTTISADEAAAQTVLSITSNTDTTSYPGTTITMTNGDFIGIELNDHTIQWTTISGTPSTTVTVNNALTAAASAGRFVWWFTNRAQRIPLVEFAALRDSNFNDTPLGIYSQVQQYSANVSKFADGTPTAVLVEPLTLNTRITLDSQPTDATQQIYLVGLYPSEDYDATTDDIAFPQEWYAALSWELAFRLSTPSNRWTQTMEMNRQQALQMARSVNPETSALFFAPGA